MFDNTELLLICCIMQLANVCVLFACFVLVFGVVEGGWGWEHFHLKC